MKPVDAVQFIVLCLTVSASGQNAVRTKYTICVNEINYGYMKSRNTTWYRNETALEVVVKRDQLECLKTVANGSADCMLTSGIVDLWIAACTEEYRSLKMIAELVTDDTVLKTPEHIVVIEKHLEVKSLHDLKGLRSCHDSMEFGFNFQLHYMKLLQFGVLDTRYDHTLSVKENQLKALSSFFAQACIPGKWSYIPDIDRRLKSTYSNLKTLCENISTVDYQDIHYVDLKCLTQNRGQIAWTNYAKVKQFFGLMPNKTAYADSKKYAYLCPDGTKRPLTLKSQCLWAKNPWNGLLANLNKVKSVSDLQKKSLIAVDNLLKEMPEAPYKIQLVDPIDSETILRMKNLTRTIINEEIDGQALRKIDFCVLSENELLKCESLSKTSFYLNFRPSFKCVLKNSIEECLQHIGTYGGIRTIDPYFLDIAERKYNLRPVMAEKYAIQDGQLDTIAVIRRNKQIQSWNDLKGGRSCHTMYGTTTGYVAPVYSLWKTGLVSNTSCLDSRILSEFFFGGSCMPDVPITENHSERLCSQCVHHDSSLNPCAINRSQAYYGDVEVLRCLVEERGDVAFVKRLYTLILSGNRPKLEWSKSSKLSDYEILCPDGRRMPLEDSLKTAQCSLIPEPPDMVVTKNDERMYVIDEIRDVLAEVSNYFSQFLIYFNLFGSYGGEHNLLFRGFTKQLVPAEQYNSVMKQYEQVIKNFRTC